MSDPLTQELKAYAKSVGADLVGVAPIERFADVPANHHPSTIFPEARSVIAVAKRITRGCIRGIEEGTQFGIYGTYAMNWLPNRFLAEMTVGIASWLEDHRWEAVALPDLPPQTPPMGIPVREGLPAPNVMVDFADAAVRCGLGEIGLTGVLMTPEFGPLQRMHLILTDGVLEPTPICTHEVCDRCGACAKACPLGAIAPDNVKTLEVCGKSMTVAAIDKAKCLRCPNGACANPSHPSGDPDRLAALCMRTCLTHLDADRRLTKPFEKPFRTRAPWAIGPSGVPGLVEEA